MTTAIRTSSPNSALIIASRMSPFRVHLLLAFILGITAVPSRAAEPLDRAGAEQKLQQLWTERVTQLQTERAGEMESKTIVLADKKLRWAERVFGEAPPNGHSLWI